MRPPRLCFIVESGTDVRMVEGLAEQFDSTMIARKIVGGVEVSHPPSIAIPTTMGASSRTKFALQVWNHLRQQRDRVDLVLVQGYGLAALAANLASWETGVPTMMLVCSPVEAYYRCRKLYPTSDKPFQQHEFLGLCFIARLNAVLGQRYIVLSKYLQHVVSSHGTRRTIEIVPIYGVDVELFSPPKEPKSVLKQKLGLPTTGSLVFFSSRISPEKDSETLLAAFRQLLDAGHDLWLLHRSGGYRSFIKDAEHFGIAERIIATDAVHPHHQLPQDYQACDLCVQASREEGLGFSPLEALACELPVVAAAVGGLQETILDGCTGWTYQVSNVKSLVACIENCLADPIEAKRRAVIGREMVCTSYNRHLLFEQLASRLAS